MAMDPQMMAMAAGPGAGPSPNIPAQPIDPMASMMPMAKRRAHRGGKHRRRAPVHRGKRRK